jgi:murein DD-endopeptidase MepM/ murein hydrolase activator NlpD
LLRFTALAAAASCALALAAPAFASYPDFTTPSRVGPGGSASFGVPLRGPFESPFGERWGRLHAGIDIAVLQTDQVRAAGDGIVTAVGYVAEHGGYGNIVEIRHGPGLVTLYAHLATIQVEVGDIVQQGQPIAHAGCTGSCTGTHLHFEVHVNGVPVDPLGFLPHSVR